MEGTTLKHFTTAERVAKFPFLIKNIEQTEEMCQVAVQSDGEVIRFIKNPSLRVQQLAIISNYYLAYNHIQNPSEEINQFFCKHDRQALSVINNPSDECKLIAITKSHRSIRWVDNPTDDMITLAMKANPHAIEFIANPSEEIQLMAIRQIPDIYYSIATPTKKATDLHNKSWGDSFSVDPLPASTNVSEEEELIKKIKTNPNIIEFIKNPTYQMFATALDMGYDETIKMPNVPKALIYEAIEKEGWRLQYIDDPSNELIIAALSECGDSIEHVKNQTHEFQMLAIKNNPNCLRYIKNPHYDVQKHSVTHAGFNISHVVEQTEELCKLAVENYPSSLRQIKTPSREVINIAISLDGSSIDCVDSSNDEELQLLAIASSYVAIHAIPYPTIKAMQMHLMLWEI